MKIGRKGQDLPLFWKMLLPLMLVTSLWIGSAVYTYFGFQDSQQQLQKLYTEDVSAVFKIEQQLMRLIRFNLKLTKYMVLESAIAMEKQQAELQSMEAQLLDGANQIITDKRFDSEGLKKKYAHFFAASWKVVELSNDFEKEDAFILYNEEVTPLFESINNSAQELLAFSAQSMAHYYEKSVDLEQTVLLRTAWISTLVTLFALAIIFLIARRVSSRLERVVRWSQRMGAGHWCPNVEEVKLT